MITGAASSLCVLLAILALAQGKVVTIENDVIIVGVDTEHGGAISVLIDRNDPTLNLINNHDQGRLVQQSYYAGPDPYKNGSFMHHPWPWNPISAGDIKGHHSQVVRLTKGKNDLYVKSIPLQWALDNVKCNCTFETWLSLDANGVFVKNRLQNHRYDTTAFKQFNQELPAVYTIGELYNLWTYTGSKPWSGGALTDVQYPIPGPPWKSFSANENWAAFTDNNPQKYGVGVMHSNIDTFLGGFAGVRGFGGPTSPNTGYIAPIGTKALAHNETYTWCYYLALGYLDTIRDYFGQRKEYTCPQD